LNHTPINVAYVPSSFSFMCVGFNVLYSVSFKNLYL